MLKLNVGLSKKVGEPDYGSRGASVNLELELDAGSASDPNRLRERIRHLFQLARGSIQEELSGNGQTAATNGNGHANSGNGNGQRSRAATQSQVRAIHAIANRQRIDLGQLLSQRFQVGRPEDLSISEASQLIDSLKSEPVGNGGGR